jgi:predicted CoA-binding protein
VEPGEAPWIGAIREVKEETGLDVEIVRLCGVYKKIEKDEIVFSFICRIVGGELIATSEAREHKYVSVDDIPKNFSPNQKERIIDALQDGVTLKEQSQSTITQELRQKVMIDKNFIYAIIGASNNPEKYGYKVMQDLISGGYRVIPINPKGGEILGKRVYATIAESPEKIDVAIMIVPPEIGSKVLPQIKEVGINKVWFQPGSESEEQIAYCKENNIQYIAGACIMIKRKE